MARPPSSPARSAILACSGPRRLHLRNRNRDRGGALGVGGGVFVDVRLDVGEILIGDAGFKTVERGQAMIRRRGDFDIARDGQIGSRRAIEIAHVDSRLAWIARLARRRPWASEPCPCAPGRNPRPESWFRRAPGFSGRRKPARSNRPRRRPLAARGRRRGLRGPCRQGRRA